MLVEELVQEAAKYVIPLMPYLVKGIKVSGKKSAEKIGELGAEKSVELATALWKKLKGKKTSEHNLLIAAEYLSKNPKDKSWQAMLKQEIKNQLETNATLRKEIATLLSSYVNEQAVHAKKNANSEIEQYSSGSSTKQTVVAEENKGTIIRQNIKN